MWLIVVVALSLSLSLVGNPRTYHSILFLQVVSSPQNTNRSRSLELSATVVSCRLELEIDFKQNSLALASSQTLKLGHVVVE